MTSWSFSAIVILFFILYISESTLYPKTKELKVKEKKFISGPINNSVFELDLVVSVPTAKEIIRNNKAYYKKTEIVHVAGLSLGYVTPWNNHGYDVAKIFANKFTHISPVWLQVRRKGELTYEITGTHDIDKNWMKEVIAAANHRRVKIVPRILLDGWAGEDFQALLRKKEEVEALAKTLTNGCTSWNFKGYVLEGWSQLFVQVDADLLIEIIKTIASQLTSAGCVSILTLPPKRHNQEFNLYIKEVFNELYDVVTAFSLMTYDFSTIQRPGPNAPIQWVNETVRFLSPEKNKRKKILTGLNFYGNAYTPNGGDAILGNRYLELLKKLKGKLHFDDASVENYFEIKNSDERYIVFYPSLYSINERIRLIRELGTGVSIWELGQGLDYFYDLI